MEGYYWRFADAASGRAVVALCGVCRAPDGPWALVALAAHPGGFVRWAVAPRAWADPAGLGVAAWDDPEPAGRGAAARERPDRLVLRGSSERLEVDLGPDARLSATLGDRVGWPRRMFGALGPAHAVPGMPQYWHAHVLEARVGGEASLAADAVDLTGFSAYAEKNWGGAFPGEWWWGQAGLDEGLVVAFAGGRLRGPVAASAIVVRVGGEVVRLAAPGALATAQVRSGEWLVRARSARWDVTLEGEGAGPPHVLPVPVPAERRAIMRSEHHLAGRLRVVARRGRRTLLRAESSLAGLEHGTPQGVCQVDRV
jgi:hypothetical protein